jgi:uracil-DNA glycosylase family 4
MDDRALRELGLLEVSRWYGVESASAPPAGEPEVAQPAQPPQGTKPVGPGAAGAGWDELRTLVRSCQACGLCKQRKQAVFGVGAQAGPWMFVGEGPGADEDEQGEPFVGQAGKLLDNMLAAIGCSRGQDTYIANVVKCRPPGNRTPTTEEAAACAPFLDRQIDLVAPKVVVALGKSAVVRLLGSDASVASLRGKVHRYRGIPVVVTYHPAYLLRSLAEKAKAWEDLLFARKVLRAATAGDPL